MKNKVEIVICLVLLLVCGKVQAGVVTVYDARCESQVCPLGVDSQKPRFSWKLSSDVRRAGQTAYQILVADSESLLKKGVGNVWDSGKVKSDVSVNVVYGGQPLKASTKYYWKVRVWDNNGSESSWSKVNRLQTGLLDEAGWGSAKWIALERMPDKYRQVPGYQLAGNGVEYLEKEARMPQFRKSFDLKGKKVDSAVMYISGLGHFELSVNGEKVGDHLLDPGWTKYDKTALYVTFDVTDKLKRKDNVVGVRLGNGFFHIPRDSTRYRKLISTYGFPMMKCKLRIAFTDGSVEEIDSDTSWKVTGSPVTFSSIYGGEDYDATLSDANWACPGYDDRFWQSAIVVDNDVRLKSQISPSLVVKNRISPVRIYSTPPGVYIYDFGQNASAIPELTVKGKRGSKVVMKPAEYLTADGLANQNNSGLNYWFSYTLDGSGKETWSPAFSYYGFRYVQVEGAVPAGFDNPQSLPVVQNIDMLHVSNESGAVGSFDCSNVMFNDIHSLIDWSIRSNMSHVLTDCPHREKLGWLEVTHLMSTSIAYLYNVEQMYCKIINDMNDCQQESGLVPNTAPEYAEFPHDFRDSPEWGSASVILPWFLYSWYGDTSVLADNYDMMAAYVDYLTGRSKDNIIYHGLGDWYDLGPAHPGYSQLTERGLTPTALYYNDLNIMAKVASLLGKSEDSEKYGTLASKVKDAFNAKFFDREKGYYDKGSQTANAMPLYFDMVPEGYRESCLNQIVADIRSRDNGMTSGDVGFSYLLRTLQREGRSDVIFDMNSQSDRPGYGYQLKQGATSLTESWSALQTASHNHCMLGHIMDWLHGGLGGIRQDDGGVAFKKFLVSPEPVGDITYANVEFDSPYGMISNSWEIKGWDFIDRVTVPVNTTATVSLPVTENSVITEGGIDLSRHPDIRIIGERNGRMYMEIGSGKYEFKVRNYTNSK